MPGVKWTANRSGHQARRRKKIALWIAEAPVFAHRNARAPDRPRPGAAMPFSLADYFQKQGLRVIETALKAVDGKPVSYLRDDDHYRMQVIQPAWIALPVGVRMLMKR